jgi:hypothetical protein
VEDVEVQYRMAVAMLRVIKAKARRFADSGNPGRRAAGKEILELLEPQK